MQVWVARNPPGFAFVWFADDRDATDAVREVDGRSINGREWRVEIVSKMCILINIGRLGKATNASSIVGCSKFQRHLYFLFCLS